MHVLSRKLNERIILNGGEIIIDVVKIASGSVRLGISAPASVSIHREEVQEAINTTREVSVIS